MVEDKRRERLRYRSWHRGTREMDLLLGSFADANLHDFSVEQLNDYEILLEANDPDIYEWITGKSEIPADYQNDVVRMVVAHKFTGK